MLSVSFLGVDELKKMLFGVLLCLLFVTLLSALNSVGGIDFGAITITTASVTTSKPTATAPTTTVPTTTAPTTIAPPEPELTPGEMLAREITPWNTNSASYQIDNGFYLAAGERNAACIPIEVAEKGIYKITLRVVSTDPGGNYYAAYINADFASAFVCESFSTSDRFISMELALDEGQNFACFYVTAYDMVITSVTCGKVTDYDIAITDFRPNGIGETEMWSGIACLTYTEGMTASGVSLMQIRSGLFTVAEDGTYDLSFIAGSKCIPSVTIYDSTGKAIAKVDYSAKWNAYGVIPDYNNASVVFIESEPLFDSDSAKTVKLRPLQHPHQQERQG